MSLNWQMPRDPFADDPNDPASFIADFEDELPELSEQDRQDLRRDLHLVDRFQRELGPRGVLGLIFFCEDCSMPHFYDWEIIKTNMRALLDNQLSPVHEPSMNPQEDRYVPWDYCLGYLDACDYLRGK